MGGKQSPGFTQEVMENIFHDMNDAKVCIDNIGIFTNDEEHSFQIHNKVLVHQLERKRFHCQSAQMQVDGARNGLVRTLVNARWPKTLEEKSQCRTLSTATKQCERSSIVYWISNLLLRHVPMTITSIVTLTQING
jgi:hypothetical protein